jgi:MtN3 and saliva related transmembrane protein
MFSIFSIGTAMWLAYGLLAHSRPVIVANLVTLLLSMSILALKLHYDHHAVKEASGV